MPNTDPSNRLEWSEENLSQVIAELYAEAETDQSLHDRLLADPADVLKGRIEIPEEYEGSIFSKLKSKRGLVLHVPEYGEAASAVLPEGTSEAEPTPNYEVTCTVSPPW